MQTQTHILPMETERTMAFLEWIRTYAQPEHTVLDIGAGNDRSQIDAQIVPYVGRLVGVDPSADVLCNTSIHEGHHMSLEAYAQTEQRQFDILFARMVVEHVEHPSAFFAACAKLLKPGGMLFAVTPNLWHYFGLITKTTSVLRVNEWLLERLIGKQKKDEYHFPTRYRANSAPVLTRQLAQAGFQSVEFRFLDRPRDYYYVLPASVRWGAHVYAHAVYRLHLPYLMGSLLLRATKEGHEEGSE